MRAQPTNRAGREHRSNLDERDCYRISPVYMLNSYSRKTKKGPSSVFVRHHPPSSPGQGLPPNRAGREHYERERKRKH